MKQLLFMVAATLLGTVGVYAVSPFCGVLIYYLFAVLRPHYMWQWSLPPGIAWSFYVAMATMGAAALGMLGVLKVGSSASSAAPEPSAQRFTGAHWAVMPFAIWILITTFTARNTDVAFLWLEEYLKIFIMYAASAYLIRTARQVWILFVVTALALTYISYEINYHYFVNHYLGIFHNGYGGLDNNGAALMLAMGVPLCWFCYEGMRRWWRWLFLPPIPVIVHAVMMTYSRGAMLSLLVMCPLLLMRSRHRVQLTVVFLAFFMLLIPMMAGPEIRARFLTLQDNEIDESAKSRRNSWAAAWRMAKENPIFGMGVRNANLYSFAYGADMEGRTIHSQYMQIAADNGLVGLTLYLWMLSAAWLSARRTRRLLASRADDDSRRLDALVNGVECSMAAYCFGSSFLSTEVFELPYLLLLLVAQAAIVSRSGQLQEQQEGCYLLEVSEAANGPVELSQV